MVWGIPIPDPDMIVNPARLDLASPAMANMFWTQCR